MRSGPGSAKDLENRAKVGQAWAALFGAGGFAGILADQPTLAVISWALALPGLAATLMFYLEARRAQLSETVEETEHDWLSLFSTTRPGRRWVPCFGELSAYDLGTDHEAVGVAGDDPGAYLPRDCDDGLRSALRAAQTDDGPTMVVVRGPSKAGKSRTLYEAVRSDDTFRDASVLCPRDESALTQLLESGLPSELASATPILWLDDLERFVTASGRGMRVQALDTVADWPEHVVIVGTAGGRSMESLATPQLQSIYRHPQVRVIALSSELSESERKRVRARFWPDAAARVIAHGIGEYLVAAPELRRRLEEERYQDAGSPAPEGAALAWAAIDCARVGVRSTLSAEMLRAIWPHYLVKGGAISQDFEAALKWALKPVYRSVALVLARDDGYEAYDWIVSYAEEQSGRDINPAAWDAIIDRSAPESALDLGSNAFMRGDLERAERSYLRAASGTDPLVARLGAHRAGLVMRDRGDTGRAIAAFQRADDAGEPDAASDLGVLLAQRGDNAAALDAYRRADDRGSADGAFNLGTVLSSKDIAAAEAAYCRADERGHARAANNLAAIYSERGDMKRARDALTRADARGDATGAANLGQILEREGHVEDARAAYERADVRGSGAGAFRLALLLWQDRDLNGAEAALRRAEARGQLPYARNIGSFTDASADAKGAQQLLGRYMGDSADAANFLALLSSHRGEDDAAIARARRADARGRADGSFTLGVLLRDRGDISGAAAAFRRALDRGHELAANDLGVMLQEHGDRDGAATAFRRGRAQGSGPACANLGALLEEDGDPEGAEREYRLADERGDGDGAGYLGVLLKDRGDSEEALRYLRRSDERGSAYGALALGVFLYEFGDRDGALVAFRQASERGDGNGAFNLGVLLEEDGDIRAAEDAFQRAHALGFARASVGHAAGLIVGGRADEARVILEQALKSEDAETVQSAGAMLGVLEDVAALAEVGARRWRYLASRTVLLLIALALAYALLSGVLRWAALACCVLAAAQVARGFFLRRSLQQKYNGESSATA